MNMRAPVKKIFDDQTGIIAIRAWNYSKNYSCLKSTYRKTFWKKSFLKAEGEITKVNGIYAYLPWSSNTQFMSADRFAKVFGLVSLSGKVIEHKDGTLRAERADILHLFCRPNFSVSLQERYKVPVTGCDNPLSAAKLYMMCRGPEIIEHNASIISPQYKREVLEKMNPILALPPPNMSVEQWINKVPVGKIEAKRGRGRPRGRKDSYPRERRHKNS